MKEVTVTCGNVRVEVIVENTVLGGNWVVIVCVGPGTVVVVVIVSAGNVIVLNWVLMLIEI